MNHAKRLIVMGGGTAGHIFPGLTVARRLINQGWEVRWLGTNNRMEADLVPKYGIDINFIRISGLRGMGWKTLLLAPARIFSSWRQACIIMKHFRPNVALGMGGYVSGPSALAAWTLGIPVILHEQNAIAGLTNKWLSKIATKVLQGVPGAFPGEKLVGNPIREEVLALPKPIQRFMDRKGKVRVLVIGGSQGARILNEIMPKVAEKLGDKIIIWHQSGKHARRIVEEAYFRLGFSQHKVFEFIHNIAGAYFWADVVVSRAGALTVSEIAAAGLPAIFVPFPHKDRQQYWNARPFEKAGSAKIFDQSKFTADSVATTLLNWNRKKLFRMAECAQKVAILDATERIVYEVISVGKGSSL